MGRSVILTDTWATSIILPAIIYPSRILMMILTNCSFNSCKHVSPIPKASAASSALFMCKIRPQDSLPGPPAEKDRLPCYQNLKRYKSTKQVSKELFTNPLYKGTCFTVTLSVINHLCLVLSS